MKTDKEISKKIEELVSDSDNFSYDDYGCDGQSDHCCGCCGGSRYSSGKTEDVLLKFSKWLLGIKEK